MLCLALHPCLQIFGFIDQTDDLVEPGIRRKASDLYHKCSRLHCSAGKHAVPGLFMYRFGFAGHGGLVHHTLLIADCSVKGDHAARPDNDLISHLYPVKGHLDAVRSAAEPYTVHIQRQLLGQCKPGTLFGVRLQPVGYRQQEHDRGGSLEVSLGNGRTDGYAIQHGNIHFKP